MNWKNFGWYTYFAACTALCLFFAHSLYTSSKDGDRYLVSGYFRFGCEQAGGKMEECRKAGDEYAEKVYPR